MDITGASIEGYWAAPAYGRLMQVQADTVAFYDLAGPYLFKRKELQQARAEWQQQGWQLDNRGDLRRHDHFLGVDYRYESYTRMSASQLPSLIRLTDHNDEGYTFDGAKELAFFWHNFAQYYNAFARRQVNWPALTSQPPVQSAEQLLARCAELIAPLRDAHIQLSLDEYPVQDFVRQATIWDTFLLQAQQRGISDEDEQWDYVFCQVERLERIKLSYAPAGRACHAANQKLHWFETKNQVGVVIIDAMEDFSGEEHDDESAQIRADMQVLDLALESILCELQDCRSLVIDLRSNPGGHDQHSQLIAKRFLPGPTALYQKQAGTDGSQNERETYLLTPSEGITLPHMPLVVLQSASTMSAAELLVLMLKQRGNTTLVGESSQGVLSDVLEKRLPCGLEFGISNEKYLSMQGEWLEATGISVEHKMEYAAPASLEAGVDPGLELAIGLASKR